MIGQIDQRRGLRGARRFALLPVSGLRWTNVRSGP